jgi:hypothetical protein
VTLHESQVRRLTAAGSCGTACYARKGYACQLVQCLHKETCVHILRSISALFVSLVLHRLPLLLQN